MAGSTVQRNAGQTYALALTTAAHSAVQINDTTNDQVNYTSFLNIGGNACAIRWNQTNSGLSTVAIPSDGNGGDYVLPPNMTTPLILATPTTPYYLSAIGAGSTTLYVTPAADQS
jgi:hypothetical protein